MSIFKINRGKESDLPAELTDGCVYSCVDTGLWFFDHYDTTNTLVRSKISSEYAEKLRGIQNGEAIELSTLEIYNAINIDYDKHLAFDVNEIV